MTEPFLIFILDFFIFLEVLDFTVVWYDDGCDNGSWCGGGSGGDDVNTNVDEDGKVDYDSNVEKIFF